LRGASGVAADVEFVEKIEEMSLPAVLRQK
jgi:hypothetical protein